MLGGGETLKINSKPKLDKVSPAMWVVANTGIMKAMVARPDFCVEQYLTYTEMIGELACRFTWTSVLLFDEEYSQRQAAVGFPWGTEAPHLSTVLLRDRQQGAADSTQQRRPYSQGQGGHRARPVGATARDNVDIGPVLWELQAEKSACNSTPEGCAHLATNATLSTPASPVAGTTTQAGTMHQLEASEVAWARQVAAEEHQQHTARHRGHSSKSSPGR